MSDMGVSELRLRLFEVFDGAEDAIDGVLDDLLGLPVCSGDRAVSGADGGHLESEEIDVGLNLSLAHLVRLSVEDAAVAKEAAGEAAEDDDLALGDLDDACALSLREAAGRYIDDGP